MINGRKIKRIGAGALILLGVTTSEYQAGHYTSGRTDIQKYEASMERKSSDLVLAKQEKVREEIREMAQKQETVLGIKHFEKPKISFEPNQENTLRDVTGTYNQEKDEIWIDLSRYSSGTLSHELGHFYVDKLNESLNNKNWRYKKGFLSFLESLFSDDRGTKLVAEGIADYFKHKTKGDTLSSGLNYKSFDEYLNEDGGSDAYAEIGYKLVAPIIDRRINRGIETLTRNLPTNRDLKSLVKYQQRVLRIVEQNSSKVKITTKP